MIKKRRETQQQQNEATKINAEKSTEWRIGKKVVKRKYHGTDHSITFDVLPFVRCSHSMQFAIVAKVIIICVYIHRICLCMHTFTSILPLLWHFPFDIQFFSFTFFPFFLSFLSFFFVFIVVRIVATCILELLSFLVSALCLITNFRLLFIVHCSLFISIYLTIHSIKSHFTIQKLL